MDWHNFKVLSIYGVIVCVFLFIIGKGELAILPIIIYPFYGLIVCVKEFRKKKKLNMQLEEVPDHIKQILICHIMKRSPKLKKRIEKNIQADICAGNYKVASTLLVEKTEIPSEESDGSPTYYLAFDNHDKYEVIRGNYESAHIGDRLWVVATPTDTMRVIQSGEEYSNMFVYGLNYEESYNYSCDDGYFVK